MRTRSLLLAAILPFCTTPVRAGPSRATGVVSFLTYNVQFDSTDAASTLALLARERADIVCLQEVTPAFAQEIEKTLAQEYPFRHVEPRSGTWGLAILSRHRIVSAKAFAQRPHRMPGLEAVVSVAGKRWTIGCIHLFPPGAKRKPTQGFFKTMSENATLRRQQAEHLVRRFAKVRGPLVLLGDFNEQYDDEAMETLRAAGLQFACDTSSADCGATWPGSGSNWPSLVEIDHVLGRGLHFTNARVVRGGGSDHDPVVADAVAEKN